MKALATALVLATLTTLSQAAKADGFKCVTVDGDLALKVYNHTESDMGTRTGAVMVVSDPAVQYGRKTVAVFSSENGTLSSAGAAYSGKVDLRFVESRRQGEYLVGTRLGELASIEVEFNHNYLVPVGADDTVTGYALFHKRDGGLITRSLVCERYLKSI